MIKLAKKNCPEAEFDVIDIRSFSHIDSRYDGVMTGFCLPYLARGEVASFFKDIVGFLKPQGIIYLSAIENEHKESEVKTSSSGDRIRIHYYQKNFLKTLLESNGFSIIGSFDLVENGDDEVVLVARFNSTL